MILRRGLIKLSRPWRDRSRPLTARRCEDFVVSGPGNLSNPGYGDRVRKLPLAPLRSSLLLTLAAVFVLAASLVAYAATACSRCIDTGSGEGADLVITSPGEDRGSTTDAGLAHLLVDGAVAITLGEGNPIGGGTTNGIPEEGDQFGYSVAAGDFNGDDWDDIAIGVPYEDVGGVIDAGAVIVLLSDDATGALDSSIVLTQGSPGFPGTLEKGDRFGFALSSEDFGANDGYDDLIIGVPYEDVGDVKNAGIVQIVKGGPNGPDSGEVETWHQDKPGVNGAVETGDRWGYTVAGSPVGDESWGTLIVGAPYEDVGSIKNAGIVQVLYSDNSGLHADNDAIFHQDTPGIGGTAEKGDRFGLELAVGAFGSGYFDLAVGVPHEDRGSLADAGIVHIINGDFDGLVTSGSEVLKQGSGQIGGSGEAGDLFGMALAAIPYPGTGDQLLAVGSPGEDIGGAASTGVVHIRFPMKEDSEGLVAIHQNKAGIKGTNNPGDEFGAALDFTDIDNDGIADLVVGGPGEDGDAGRVWVIYGSNSGFTTTDVTFEQGDGTFGGTHEPGDRFGEVVIGSRR